jgi:two-component sensor histidine kinase
MIASTDAKLIADLESDNRRLRRLLNQRDAPGELRHRLRSTLALFRAVMTRSARTQPERDVLGYVAHLEDRLEAITRAQALADRHGDVDLRNLLLDELFHYGASEGERLLLSGPDIQLQLRAGQILALAIHELAVNAVEHGALGANPGRIEASWDVAADEPGPWLHFTWREFGASPIAKAGRPGFGTEVLTRMLPYNLRAKTDLMFGPNGLHCVFCLPLAELGGAPLPS